MRTRALTALAAAGVLGTAGAAAAGAPVSRTIPVGPDPIQVAAQGDDVWVLYDDGASERTVRRLDPVSLRLTGPLTPVGTFGSTEPFLGGNAPRSPMVAAYGSAWVLDATSRSVLRVDPRRGVVARIPVTGFPRDVAVGPAGLWVLDACLPFAEPPEPFRPCDGRALLRIDPATNAVTQRIAFDRSPPPTVFGTRGPGDLAVGRPGVFWLSRATPGRTLVRRDSRDGRLTDAGPAWTLGRGRATLWIAPRNGCRLFAKPPSGGTRILPEVFRGARPGLCYPRGVAIGPRGNLWVLYFTSRGSGRVIGVNAATGRVEKRRTVGRNPVAIASGAGGVWVVNRGDGTLTRFPTSTSTRARARPR